MPLSSQQVLWRHNTQKSALSHSLNPKALHHLSQISSGTLLIALQWCELIKVLWPPRGSLHRSWCKNLNLLLRREQRADQIASSTKEGLILPDNRRCALCSRGRERKRKLDVGWRAGLHGEIWIFVASRTCVDQRQCGTCVLTSSKHVPLMLRSSSGVCYTAVRLQVVEPGPVGFG